MKYNNAIIPVVLVTGTGAFPRIHFHLNDWKLRHLRVSYSVLVDSA